MINDEWSFSIIESMIIFDQYDQLSLSQGFEKESEGLCSEFFRYWRYQEDYTQDLLQKTEEFSTIDYMDSD